MGVAHAPRKDLPQHAAWSSRKAQRGSTQEHALDGPAAIARLQSVVGNRAVSAALASVRLQRQPQHVGTENGVDLYELPRVDDDLGAVLAQIDRALDLVERVSPYEAITSTTVAELSVGDLERSIERLWQRERLDFTGAARRAESEPPRGRATTATASARLQAEREYAIRRTLNLYAADYERSTDLTGVARIARAGSPFRRALEAEFGEQATLLNPTGRQMDGAIFDAILRLWTDLQPTQAGELVVTFSGHGRRGRIVGVDQEAIGPDRLDALGRFAADHGVHLVFILDTCRAGTLVEWAQANSLWDVEVRIAGLPRDVQSPFVARLNALKRLTAVARPVGEAAFEAVNRVRALERRRSTENRVAQIEQLLGLSRAAIRFGEALAEIRSDLPGREVLQRRQEALGWSALGGSSGAPGGARDALRDAASLLDAVNETLNLAIPALDRDARAADPNGRSDEGGTAPSSEGQ